MPLGRGKPGEPGALVPLGATGCQGRLPHTYYLGMVIQRVFGSSVVTAVSSSSRPPDFLSFFTRLLTAFSLHLSSPSPFLKLSSLFTTGGVKGNMDIFSETCMAAAAVCSPPQRKGSHRVPQRTASATEICHAQQLPAAATAAAAARRNFTSYHWTTCLAAPPPRQTVPLRPLVPSLPCLPRPCPRPSPSFPSDYASCPTPLRAWPPTGAPGAAISSGDCFGVFFRLKHIQVRNTSCKPATDFLLLLYTALNTNHRDCKPIQARDEIFTFRTAHGYSDDTQRVYTNLVINIEQDVTFALTRRVDEDQ